MPMIPVQVSEDISVILDTDNGTIIIEDKLAEAMQRKRGYVILTVGEFEVIKEAREIYLT